MDTSDTAINQTAKSQSYDDFIKEHLPILPEWQFKYKPLLDTVSPDVRQRVELMSRAYSAAVYAHKNHLSPSQKQSIINEFNTQCFSVLGQISEIVEFAKGNPVAERHALLKEYQLWINQLEDLLKKAIYALDYDEWAQQIEAVSSSNASSKETVKSVLRKVLEVFDPYIGYGNYYPKFNSLFHSQAQLEQRVSLALGITVEGIDALVATRKKTEKSHLLNERVLTGEALALAMLVEHPDWPDTKIAKAVGVSRTTLYDWPAFKKAKEALKQGKDDLPNGSKDGETSDMEAWDNKD
jgi:hypothetical protein